MEIKIKYIHTSKHELSEKTILKFLPCIIPKGTMNALDDIYLSSGHAIKYEGKWGGPHDFGMRKCNYQELLNLGLEEIEYYHIELEREEGETRRDKIIICEGVFLESFSDEKL